MTNQVLEFHIIKQQLMDYAHSEKAKQRLSALEPYLKETEITARTKETTDARILLDALGLPPFVSMKDLDNLLDLAEKGSMLLPEQLEYIAQFASASKRLADYFKRGQNYEVELAYYVNSMEDLSPLREDIFQSIRNKQVDDYASPQLKSIRKELEQINQQIHAKLDSIMKGKKQYFSDSYVSVRNGHFVLPVKKEYKLQISGSVIDTSSSGATYFIEPTAISKLQETLSLCEIEEDNEVRKILYSLTCLVHQYAPAIRRNMDAMETLDFIFAKARLSSDLNAVPAKLNTQQFIHIKKGRHPLLAKEKCVPLDFSIGNGIRGIIITGPNTGGKTVAIKTVGLLSIMAQCGLHIPCENADICITNQILCDIGDGQSITENLSTFSSHITNVIHILQRTTVESLVLLDELGSGTDPQEGMGIAIAILEELRKKNCLFIATTHYPEVKDYALRTEGLSNARMAFDRESLKPLYQLEIGEAGESCAIYIAKRLGMSKEMLTTAYQEAYGRTRTHSFHKDVFLEETISNVATETSNSAWEPIPEVVKNQTDKKVGTHAFRFEIGDSVVVYPQKKIGIVYQTANGKGEIGVQIQGNKQLINHKRLKLKASAKELYPDDYDFSIIFDSVENRKARHKMEKKHIPGVTIETPH
ncbi:endonuclease MutS2 [Anaeromicropila populeti]|uniref:MutS domain V n=1 Tax=Anaeromicropila populeti TaxID=37658 RepID=A0A1I6JWM1_9FIRM|nr:DNA mismatch repair protein MutS [Anaeromicropila populeti]SFR83343.1 MutS domain V [Anaeromicropila populeti]